MTAVVAEPALDGTLARRIGALRRAGTEDLLQALLAEAADRSATLSGLALALSLPLRDAAQLTALPPDFTRLPFAQSAQRRCALLRKAESDAAASPCFVVTDPFDTDLVAWARTAFGSIDVVLASDTSFDAWLAQAESSLTALSADDGAVAIARPSTSLGAEVISLRDIGRSDSPAVRFVNATLYDALKAGASDIHLECHPAGLQVKFRLDGVLNAIARLDSAELAAQAISRIKVMAQLDIAERRVPQDGRLQISVDGRAVDVRVSIMPSIHGEDAVLRILDRRHLAESLSGLTLARLGFDAASAEALRRLCRRPHGMLLVTGPTGSGKTTTLYAAISETHLSRDKIVTIEDPVEYQLPGVLQIPVNERKGLTFARGLRSILRHDPDKILVGEIRDAETAQIAVQSALTGHLVFTTVHANTVFDVVGRFEQFGIDAYTFSSAINGILAQRLFRSLCGRCAQPIEMQSEGGEDAELALAVQRGAKPQLMQAVGCAHCRGTGYVGRFALGELLLLTPAVKALLAARAPLAQIQAEAERNGWRSLRALALAAAVDGHTTLEEVDRVAL
jgi:general secretion pathway protein E